MPPGHAKCGTVRTDARVMRAGVQGSAGFRNRWVGCRRGCSAGARCCASRPTELDRSASAEVLTAEIAKAFSTLSADDAMGRFEAAGIANARLRDLVGLVEQEQLAARNRWREVDSPVG
ncbi:MAG: CoA transferase [Actinobacteria bacterium]|nr:CoA transferase [Actinomycetota bacterium]